MDVLPHCERLKAGLAAELAEAQDDLARSEVLVAALYELSRSVLPALGQPDRSQKYLENQAVVLELVSFIAIPLIRCATGDTRGVAVLIEIAEGCRDPFLKKKFSVYAQELLAKCEQLRRGNTRPAKQWVIWGAALASLLLCLYLALPQEEQPEPVAHQSAVATVRAVPAPAALQPAPAEPVPGPAASGPAPAQSATRAEAVAEQAEPRAPVAPAAQAGPAAEKVTKVRVVNNQVLVPVLVRHGAQSVRVDLVLDTGATHSSIHDSVAGKLKVDLRLAKLSQAEVADGRLVHSLSITVDSLSVGPFTVNSADLEVMPYRGSQGGHDGLLGMDFLGKHTYQIDMEHELIRWF